MNAKNLIIVWGALLTVQGSAVGSIIDDKSQFVGDFTVIDFETFADGTPIILEPGHGGSILPNFYASLGVWITAETVPVIFRGDFPQWLAAHEASGSGLNAISDVGGSGFLRFDFALPVNAFGLAVMHVPDRGAVSFAAFDAGDQLIQSVDFVGNVVDGVVPGSKFGSPFDYEYGFLGLYTPSREIAYGVVSQGSSSFDDLHYGIIPEPWTLALLLGAIGAVGLTRVQRSARGMMSPIRRLLTPLRRGPNMYARHFIAASAIMLAVNTLAMGSIIDDKSQFVGDFTVIDFETFADGTPIDLEPGQAGSFLPSLYAPLGVRISGASIPLIGRFDSATPQAIAALDAVGSPTNVLGGYFEGPDPDGWLRLDFTVPVNAVGVATINRSDGAEVTFGIYDAFDQLIETADFAGAVIDGSMLAADFDTEFDFDFDYGFLGLFSVDTPIAYAVMSEDITTFDDLHFGVIPEPGTLALLGLSVLAGTYLRRRKLGRVPSRVAWSFAAAASLALSNPVLADSDISGHVEGWADLTEGPICGDNGWPGCPAHSGLSLVDLEGVRVCACEPNTEGDCDNPCLRFAYTDSGGYYVIPYSGSGALRVDPDLDGEFARVGRFEDEGGVFRFVISDLVPAQDLSAPPYTGIDFVFNPDGEFGPDYEQESAEVTAFYHTTRAHDFFRDRQPSDLNDFTEIDVPITVDTGMLLSGSCTIGFQVTENFGQLLELSPSSFQQCSNAASRSSVPFTYGVFLTYVRSLSEEFFQFGTAEAFALLATDDPILFPNWLVSVPEGHSYDFEAEPTPAPRRSLADECIIGDPPDEERLCHEILAGIWWDIKLNMETKYENPEAVCPIAGLTSTACGLEVARRLFVRWTLMTAGNFDLAAGEQEGPKIALDLLPADDDNDDLSDGTPHCNRSAICNGERTGQNVRMGKLAPRALPWYVGSHEARDGEVGRRGDRRGHAGRAGRSPDAAGMDPIRRVCDLATARGGEANCRTARAVARSSTIPRGVAGEGAHLHRAQHVRAT